MNCMYSSSVRMNNLQEDGWFGKVHTVRLASDQWNLAPDHYYDYITSLPPLVNLKGLSHIWAEVVGVQTLSFQMISTAHHFSRTSKTCSVFPELRNSYTNCDDDQQCTTSASCERRASFQHELHARKQPGLKNKAMYEPLFVIMAEKTTEALFYQKGSRVRIPQTGRDINPTKKRRWANGSNWFIQSG